MNFIYRSISVVIPVFRDGARAVAAARQTRAQRLPTDVALEIILVDDGSDDDTAARLAGLSASEARVLRLATNQGRSAARNAGAETANGDILVFMDSDCLPMGEGFLSAHLDALASGAVGSTGAVIGDGGGFWDRYQREASQRRERQHRGGMRYAGSSQNLAVRREVFGAVGGFDTGYRRYGFEDRDLLLRLAYAGKVTWTAEAVVRHLDRIDLAQVSSKMAEAGALSSARFANAHPEAYRALGFARLDARTRRWLRTPGRVLDGTLPPIARGVDLLLQRAWIPYAAKAAAVRLVTGLSYLAGTSRPDARA